MKIAALVGNTSEDGGGMAIAAIELCRSLRRRGLDVSIFSSTDHGRSPDLISYKVAYPARFEWSRELMGFLREGDFDIVHTHGLWTYRSIAALTWRAETKRPIIISPHGILNEAALARSAIKKKIARFLFEKRHIANAACLHALNRAEEVSIRHQGYRGPVAIIPNGVELADRSLPAARPEWARDAGKRTLLYLGRIHPGKGLMELVVAWRKLLDTDSAAASRWQIVIAGWDEAGFKKVLESKIEEFSLDGRVIFPGPIFGEEKRAAFLHSSSLILPSHYEGMPMAVLEAWAHGLPVIMTPECNLAEGFDAGAAFPITRDAEKMARQLGQIIADESAFREAGEKGRELVSNFYSWELAAKRMGQLYKDLCCARGGATLPGVVERSTGSSAITGLEPTDRV